MITSYTIEWMREQDLLEVVRIEETSGLNRWGYEAYRRELLKNPNAIMLVARDQRTISPERSVVGFFAAWIVEDELHINNIASRKDSRRIGIGHSLMESALEEARNRGVRFVLLEVRASNQAAQSLYTGLGFRFVGRRRDYYRSPTEDALMMRLDLTHGSLNNESL
ncbi:MAG TPA: ribosomal protein S18-alanine N-acetyltransferase [Blastocatellia bacterium]|nr:ribosomal protein S18-alanine N-acetyltransferase [Blastocatellia bacterium]